MAEDESGDPFRGWDKVDEVVLGEVTTRFLPTSIALEPNSAGDLLARLVPGSRPERHGHAVERLVSAGMPFNVDCHLATPKRGPRVRAIGVVAAHAVLTGGHVLQASAGVRAVAGETSYRRRWSYYSVRPGYVEVPRKVPPEDLADGFLAAVPDPALLDLTGVCRQIVDQVTRGSGLDQKIGLRSQPLEFRWVARVASTAGMPEVDFLRCPDGSFQIDAVTNVRYLGALIRFCEDVALHSWLLATMSGAFASSMRTPDQLDRLGPALEFLGHLWSPGEAIDEKLESLWSDLEARLHLTRGWNNQVMRVRDKISLLILKGLQQQQQTKAASDNW